ncbi:UDP-N-acetylglucosamine--LPS N-acetylglucosamine transferase [Paenibacillus sp. IHBB 10380]|uniref:UDP-N-acetylglucosamine--LPS N-acetylglucosamine transferase n=1 Tax=Paenibacillus sp. IHBB 10380 TaxID=1566358 RepID=UPI0005CFDD2E|nr:UDP-N-acetylglucosamine--LPS N-acetylglucosamine transferase [Paenibacillus sp. IHBB 10380]AJS60052.1 UDP-N-acetylglucosamine:LPS N-acetylglucosamine transferase [Paenibacillus sp. IHBB 10380]
MRKKRILFLSEGFGTGHTQAAHALASGMKKLHPHLQCRVIELGNFLNPTVGPWILSAYRKTVSTTPAIIGMFYRNKYDKSLNRLTQLALHRIFYTHAAQVLSQLKPDIIICTHPIPNSVISRLKRQGVDVPLITLITDYDVHGTWVNPEVNQYLVSSPRVKNLLLERGVASHHIKMTGIPVHPDFWERGNRDQLRAEFNLKSQPTVLVMGGGWGLAFKRDFLVQLTSWADHIQLIFCVGSNLKLLDKMKENPIFDHPNITLLGYSSQINKLMDVSDLLITKPGGMTCTEGLIKGIPMIFYEAIPGQEEQNSLFFVNRGFAETLHSTVLNRWFKRLTTDYEEVVAERNNKKSTESYLQPCCCAQTVVDMLKMESLEQPREWTITP